MGWDPGAVNIAGFKAWTGGGQGASFQAFQVELLIWPEPSRGKDPAASQAPRKGSGVPSDQESGQAAKASEFSHPEQHGQ